MTHNIDTSHHRHSASDTIHSHSHHGHSPNHLHHSNHHENHANLFKQKFLLSLVFGLPVLILSPFMGIQLPFQFSFPGSDWVVLVLSTVLFLYGGQPFLKGAKDEFKAKEPGMMALISLGITVAYLYSLYAFIMNSILHTQGHVMDFFWELASLILIMLLGHWIEMKALGSAGNALDKMSKLLPDKVTRMTSIHEHETISLSDIEIGDTLIVKAGEHIPSDGIIKSGQTSVNESLVTGEARAIEKQVGDTVIGGSINLNGTIQLVVSSSSESGYLAQVMELVAQAQQDKSHAESLADRVAKWLFYIAVIVSLLAFIGWYWSTGDINTAFIQMVTVLIIACPHALGLAIPLVVSQSTSLAARQGLLIKQRTALELASSIDYILMDKTGTLTEGDFKVNTLVSLDDNYTTQAVGTFFYSLEVNSTHPLAQAIIDYGQQLALDTLVATEVQEIPGTGLEGMIQGKQVKIVNARYLDKETINYDRKQFITLSSQGNSISYLLINNQVVGLVALGDQIKDDAKSALDAFHQLGIKVAMLTGDNDNTAQKVGQMLAIDDIHSNLMPADKEKLVASYQAKGYRVMMVGDGINDAPSLARADIGVAIGAGTDVAIDSAQVILVKSQPSDIIKFFSLAKNTHRKMIENLWWGAGYNLIAIPLAAGILAPWGIVLSPAVGAIIMSLSTVIVALNAMTLKIK